MKMMATRFCAPANDARKLARRFGTAPVLVAVRRRSQAAFTTRSLQRFGPHAVQMSAAAAVFAPTAVVHPSRVRMLTQTRRLDAKFQGTGDARSRNGGIDASAQPPFTRSEGKSSRQRSGSPRKHCELGPVQVCRVILLWPCR